LLNLLLLGTPEALDFHISPIAPGDFWSRSLVLYLRLLVALCLIELFLLVRRMVSGRSEIFGTVRGAYPPVAAREDRWLIVWRPGVVRPLPEPEAAHDHTFLEAFRAEAGRSPPSRGGVLRTRMAGEDRKEH